MKRQTRYLIAFGIGFVAYRITVEFLAWPSAILIGLILAGCTWALTGIHNQG